MSALRWRALALAAVLLAVACRKESPLAGLSADQLRSEGLAKMNAGEPGKARAYFEALVVNAGADPAEAEYLIGTSFYKQKLYDEAYVHFDQIIDRYPASEWCDDAQLMKGETKLASALPLDKDQSAVEEALDDFLTLTEEYENSPLVPDARDGIARCRRLIAAKLARVGKFYKKTGAYRAAATYFDNIYADYPEYDGLAEAVYYAGVCYASAGEKETAAARYRLVVERFGASPYAAAAAAQLKDLEK